MALETEGRVVLKIYDKKKSLMIARPCASQAQAEEWAQGYIDQETNAWTAGYTYTVTAMVPRI